MRVPSGAEAQCLILPFWEALQFLTKNPVTLFGQNAFILVAPLLTSPAFLCRTVGPTLTVNPLGNSIDNHADPEVHQQSEIKPLRKMASPWRKVWHQDKKVNQVAHDNGNELLEESAEHETVVHQERYLAVGI